MKRVLIILVVGLVLEFLGTGFGWWRSEESDQVWMDRVVHAQVVATVPTISGCTTGPAGFNSIYTTVCTLTDASGTRHWLVVTTSSGGIAIMEDK